ncbi:MAG: hypothetical protein M1821_002418 [Bathelium mastoideum]|nr:MAG: hypothetical protein M1821_002418 [Bathelium mastoideum]
MLELMTTPDSTNTPAVAEELAFPETSTVLEPTVLPVVGGAPEALELIMMLELEVITDTGAEPELTLVPEGIVVALELIDKLELRDMIGLTEKAELKIVLEIILVFLGPDWRIDPSGEARTAKLGRAWKSSSSEAFRLGIFLVKVKVNEDTRFSQSYVTEMARNEP